ncbi:hypothetical protein CONPUDRAFT_164113 [Coniophora puteana RWD-64-598 SS2]|uniref:DUF6593 domain-containing protein n=1 Tax=Coniophora puteana (strain RWD-64-598) TaxID=741705 RepID=A0A5M3MVB2_CONPW|nr:uncharacterized protein CONPUDRAFT_164113 [Coniophora puteana RWD-64-598 SS2]EIW83112.1 hypothetical protein CONPUDRAFT_164113 [Coniophora puteana RWD-64-598 SS2]
MPPPPKKPDPPHKLNIATNSIRNTTFASDNDKIYYEVVTRFWHPRLTKVIKHDFEMRCVTTIAEIEWLPKQEMKVRFNPDGQEGEWMPATEFINYDQKNGGMFTGGDGVEYRWRMEKRMFQLVKENDGDKTPIAEYRPYQRHFFVWRMSQRARMDVKKEAMSSLEKIIVSYLLVEKRRRQNSLPIRAHRP